MRILLSPIGSRGDVQPQVVLAQELRRRGHDVVFATCPNFEPTVRAQGFEFIPIGRDSNEVIRENAAFAERNPLFALRDQLAMITQETQQQCTDLLDADLPRFDVVVGAGLSYAAHLLAERQGAKYAFVCYSLAGMQSASHPPMTLPVFGLPRVLNRGLWALIRTLFRASIGKVVERVRTRYGLPTRDAWYAVHYTNVILAQDDVMGELPPDVPGNVVQVPALSATPNPSELPTEVATFLERRGGEHLVYVGFGSMPSSHRARIVDSVKTFCDTCQARVLIFSAHDEDRQFALPDSVLSVGPLDHARLFPKLDLVIHHGGAGTTAAALRAGVPQLIVPHIVDQFYHARRVAQLGLGPAPGNKRALGAHLQRLSWPDVARQHEHARALARTLPANGAPAAADYLERLV